MAITILLMAGRLVASLSYALAAVQYPFELDYGEGIVWQQAMLIPSHMYGDITQYPFIVFHYPPVYHLAVRAIAALGVHPLLAGRSLSLIATLATAVLSGALAFRVTCQTGRPAALIGAVVAGLCFLSFAPVVFWAPLMRVDMLAIALSMAGVCCAVRSAKRPWLLYLATIAFVLAVFTKQTSIAAPLATMPVMLVVTPRPAVKACMFGLLLGGAAVAILTWMTDGGFERHVLLYNLNRYSLRAAAKALWMLLPHLIFVTLALAAIVTGWQRFKTDRQWPSAAAFRSALANDAAVLSWTVLTLYFALTTAMLLTLGKSGGGANYFIEWMSVLSVLIGSLMAHAAAQQSGWTVLLPIAVLVQVLILPATPGPAAFEPRRMQALAALQARIHAADQPVLSDDMVLLMQAGKGVPWEPAIFAELASTGQWDERRITALIAARHFAFVITQGQPGDALFESRYTPAVQRAITAAYPDTEQTADHTIHRPPSS